MAGGATARAEAREIQTMAAAVKVKKRPTRGRAFRARRVLATAVAEAAEAERAAAAVTAEEGR